MPIVAFAANQEVINTNDSGAGSLRQAVVDVGAGEDVGFQPAVAGGTINLSSNLDVTKSMNFVNSSGGTVTTDLGSNRMSVTNGSTIALDSDLTFQTSTSSDAYTVYADDGMIIDGGIGGTIRATSTEGAARVIYVNNSGAGTLTINGGILEDGLIEVRGDKETFAISSADDMAINGPIAGTIRLETTSAYYASGIHSNSGGITIDGIAGTGSIELQSPAPLHGIRCQDDLTITSGIAGSVTATSLLSQGVALYASNNVTISGGNLRYRHG